MEHTHLLTAGESAKAVGISGAAISKAISSGRLPYVEKTKQGYLIDPATLFHVFRGGRKKPAPETSPSDAPHIGDASAESIALRIANARLETELSGLRAILHAERQRAETAERDRDGWRTLAQSIVESKRHPNG
jgi:hypothetical protein